MAKLKVDETTRMVRKVCTRLVVAFAVCAA
jgi:hypothetical protein